MKRLIALLLVLSSFMTTAHAAMILEYNGGQHNYTGSVYSLMVNGKSVSVPLEPIIFNDRALVPVREVFEAMGAVVTYIPATREITVDMGEIYVSLQIDNKYAFVNGNKKEIPDGLVPMLIAKLGESAKTMVPVRFVSENIGMNVIFDGANGVIKVNNPSQYVPEEDKVQVKDNYIRRISASQVDDEVTLSITFEAPITKLGELTFIKSSGVLYCDVYDTGYKTSNNLSINKGAVKAVRLGEHEEYTRIALDTSGSEGYYKKLSSDGMNLKITVKGTMPQVPDTPATSTPTNKPTSTPSTSPSTSPTPTPTPTPTPEAHLKGEKIVVLDAGHGGYDPGAIYTHDEVDYQEKVINLAVATKVQELLTAQGIRVEMTRDGDTYPTLTERADFANKLGAAMFVSIHTNSIENNNDANGIEVYYSKTNNSDRYGLTSKKLATDVYKNLIKNTSATQRGVKTEQHSVTRRSEMPAILIELGFITNKEEILKLSSSEYQELLAGAIAAAIIDNMGTVQIPPLPMPSPAAEDIITEGTENISE